MRVLFLQSEPEPGKKKSLQYRILQKLANAKIVREDPDLIIMDTFCLESKYPLLLDKYPNARVLLISGENIFKRHLFSYSNPIRELIKKGLSLLGLRKEYSTYAFPKCIEYIKDNREGTFSILTNKIPDRDNVLSVPLWMHCDDLVRMAIEVKRSNAYRNKEKFCVFIGRNLTPARIEFIRKLSRYKRVDRYFYTKRDDLELFKRLQFIEAFSNLQIGWNRMEYERREDIQTSSDNWKIYKDYKFVINFENSIADDYITEKILCTMAGNSVPLYYGTPNIAEYFNAESFIDYNHFQSFDAMIEKIIALDQDNAKFQAMLDQPFFPGNQLPERVASLEEDALALIDRELD